MSLRLRITVALGLIFSVFSIFSACNTGEKNYLMRALNLNERLIDLVERTDTATTEIPNLTGPYVREKPDPTDVQYNLLKVDQEGLDKILTETRALEPPDSCQEVHNEFLALVTGLAEFNRAKLTLASGEAKESEIEPLRQKVAGFPELVNKSHKVADSLNALVDTYGVTRPVEQRRR